MELMFPIAQGMAITEHYHDQMLGIVCAKTLALQRAPICSLDETFSH